MLWSQHVFPRSPLMFVCVLRVFFITTRSHGTQVDHPNKPRHILCRTLALPGASRHVMYRIQAPPSGTVARADATTCRPRSQIAQSSASSIGDWMDGAHTTCLYRLSQKRKGHQSLAEPCSHIWLCGRWRRFCPWRREWSSCFRDWRHRLFRALQDRIANGNFIAFLLLPRLQTEP